MKTDNKTQKHRLTLKVKETSTAKEKPPQKAEKAGLKPKKPSLRNTGKRRTVVINNYTEWEKIKKSLSKASKNFEIVTSGSVSKLKYGWTDFIYVNKADFSGKGFHISRMFRKDVDNYINRIKADGGSIPFREKNYKEQMFCLGHIEDLIGVPVVMIDIAGCYWQTAYKLGYTSYEVYIAGNRKDEWKTGRNAAIGALCKREYTTPYIKGVANSRGRRFIEPSVEYQSIRNHVIGYIYEKFHGFYENTLRRKFCMFLTDAVVTTPDAAKQIKQLLWLDGYISKQKTIEFTHVDRKNKTIHWFDFDAEILNEAGEKIGQGVKKYYQYSLHQVIPDFEKTPTNRGDESDIIHRTKMPNTH